MKPSGAPFADLVRQDSRRVRHGQAPRDRRPLAAHRTLAPPAQAAAPALSRAQADRGSQRLDRHPLRPQDGHQLGGLAGRDGLRLRDDLLASPGGLDPRRGLAEAARGALGRAGGGQEVEGAKKIDWSRASIDSSFVRARGGGGKTGPSPVGRRKEGSKRAVIVDAHGIPLAAITTAANVPDVVPTIELVDAIPPVRGKPGRPRRRPRELYGDRGFDSDPNRRRLRRRGIRPRIARRKTAHGSGLGVYRW
jgi:hypothetical protein